MKETSVEQVVLMRRGRADGAGHCSFTRLKENMVKKKRKQVMLRLWEVMLLMCCAFGFRFPSRDSCALFEMGSGQFLARFLGFCADPTSLCERVVGRVHCAPKFPGEGCN